MTRLLLPFLLLLGAPLAGAQTIAVRTLALSGGAMPEVFLKGPKQFQSLQFSTIQPGEVVQAVAARPLPLYRLAANEEGEEGYTVARKITVPSGAKGLLLLGWRTGEAVSYVALDDDFGSARFNDWLLINTGKRPIAFRAGERSKPVMVAPGKSVKYRIAADKGTGATVHAQSTFDGETKTFYSTYWPVHEGKRTVVLFVDDGSKIRVKRISDSLAPPPAP